MAIAAAALTIAAAPPATKSAPPAAEPVPPATTVNCLLASNVFAQRATDPKQKELAQQMLLFYLGRLEPRTSSAQLKSSLKLALDGLKTTSAGPLMNNCLSEFRAKAQMFETAGQELQQGK